MEHTVWIWWDLASDTHKFKQFKNFPHLPSQPLLFAYK